MKRIFPIIILSLLFLSTFSACAQSTENKSGDKTLVTYFSATGNTREAAKQIAQIIDGDLYEIQPLKPYSAKDIDWNKEGARANLEMFDYLPLPEVTNLPDNLSQYETVWIGYPIWWNKAPKVINSFIESCNLKGKRIILFATSHETPIDNSVKVLRELYPELSITDGILVNHIDTSYIKQLATQ